MSERARAQALGAGARRRRGRVPLAAVLLAAASTLFALLAGLGIHGFSLPYWHALVDGSPPVEVLAGRAREQRWDDHAVQLPFALAQAAHDPPFPVVNGNIGLGQNMLVPTTLPVAHVATLFRPTVWGFFLGGDRGLAWMWWAQILGVLVVWLAVFRELLGAPPGLAAGGCLLMLGSPFFQFWSFNMAPATMYAGSCALALFWLASARRPGAILASGLLLGWAGGCFLLTIYPPYLISLGVLLAVLVGGVLRERRSELRPRERGAWRVAGLGLAVACSAFALAALHSGASEAIAALRHTEYPGRRASNGGDRPIWWLLNAALAVPPQVGDRGWGSLVNVCEAASCWIVSPVIALVLAWRAFRRAGRPDLLTLGLLGYCLVGLVYCHSGIPDSLARATLLADVPGKRALLGLTVAEAILVVRFATSARAGARGAPGLRAGYAVLAAAWTVALGASALRLRIELPELRLAPLAAAALANGLAVYALSERWHSQLVVAAVASALCASAVWFNPLVRGGAGFLQENPVARRAVEIDRALGGRTVWAVYGHGTLANMLVANGLQVVNGQQSIPQLELWERIDPRREHLREYNRYASVFLIWPPPRGQGAGIGVARDAKINLYLDPGGEQVRRFGVTHLLVTERAGRELKEYFSAFEPLARFEQHALYSLPLERVSAR